MTASRLRPQGARSLPAGKTYGALAYVDCMSAVPSSIDNMSVAQVRRALAQLRRSWDEHAPDNPIFPSDLLPNLMTLEMFAFLFVLSHHERRHQKSSSRRPKHPSSPGPLPNPSAAKSDGLGGKKMLSTERR